MSLYSSYGPGLGAEIAYRRERIADAARGTGRVRRGRARRATRTVPVQNAAGRMGIAPSGSLTPC